MRSILRRAPLAPLALLAAVALALPVAAQAADAPRYTYIEGGYLNIDLDDFNRDGDGFGVGASYALNDNVHLLADYQTADLGGPIDLSVFAIGAGVNYPIRSGLDFVGRLRIIDADYDVDDDTGFGLEAGVRTMINSRLELNGSLRYVDVVDNNTSIVLGAFYDVVPNLALGGDLEISDDVTAVFLRARWHFRPPSQLN